MNTDPTTVATKIVTALRDEQFAAVASFFAPPLQAVASADSVQAAWAAEINKSGPVAATGEPVAETMQQGLVRVSVPVTQERGELTVLMSVDDKGMLQGFRLAPAVTAEWAAPAYAKPGAFTEEEVSVEAASLSVAGTLSVPAGSGLHPAVVLLGGGGPFDRDETYGPNKPLKDIAWGLASRGIVVLRFDKVTHTHARVANEDDFTMTEEYVPHAVAAVQLLQKHPAVDAAQLFVLGHSMGGKVAPRIAAAEPAVAGLVILAGDTQPMQQAAVRVASYLAEVNPTGANKQAVAIISRQAQAVDDPALSTSTKASALPFGFSASYWLDMRAYDPVAAAAKLHKPMFIAQGGRDYQVTIDDDFARWKTGLSAQPGVVFRIYPTDNHLFFPGKGQSTPAEYESPQHVDVAVIKDIARWVNPPKGLLARLRAVFAS